MLSLPDDISNAIQSFGKSKISSNEIANDGVETYTHCTILYGFPQSVKFDDVKDYLVNSLGLDISKKLKISLGEIKRFECPEYDVIYIDVQNCFRLHEIHFALKDKFNVVTTYPVYNPHVTISYVKKGSCKHLDGITLFYDIEVECNQITFSTGGSEQRIRQEINYESFKEKFRNNQKVISL
jgi:2'-5' RNA ligase